MPNGQVWKREWILEVWSENGWGKLHFGLKQGQDLEKLVAHPLREFSGVPPWAFDLTTHRGAGGTPIHYLYWYVPPNRVVILKLLI